MLFFCVLFVLPLLTSTRYHSFQQNFRNAHCQCMPPELCDDEDVAINGHGLLQPRIDHPCPNLKEICCTNPYIPQSHETADELPKPRCGLASATFKPRIMSGTNAAFGELPWNLIIQESGGDKSKNIYKCGGSLIHPRVAITAAHCVKSYTETPEKLVVRAGEWNIDSRDEPLPPQDKVVEEILIHFAFNPLSLQNDIAILILVDDFELMDNVKILCLATSNERVLENVCVASGWGKNAQNNGRYSSVLKKVRIPIVSRERCRKILRGTVLGPRYKLHKSFVCAGGKRDEDSCKGDGGSPLICPLLEEKERFVQVGIVSWGLGCGNEGIPGVYVNVPLYYEWIENEMEERDLDTTYFKI